MTNEDYKTLQKLAPFFSDFERIGVFSPTREREVFPKAKKLSRWRWDLNQPGKKRFDLLIAVNVFKHSQNPERWFRHVFACCRYFLLIDLVKRRRHSSSEFGPDRDVVRFCIGDERPRVPQFFDLNRFENRLIGYQTYAGGANEFDPNPLHLAALFRGDLAVPVLRIDDFPTGIRPVLGDLEPLYAILRNIDDRGIGFHLGIVPALLDSGMSQFLRTLRHMIPAVHGYDHAYFSYSPLLEKKGDPYNQSTVRHSFDEFTGASYAQLLDKLARGRELLHEKLGQAPEAYIPPCNRANRRTGRALEEAGYSYYLSEKKIPACALPQFKSDFYGRSSQYDYTSSPQVITLHLTWEWDLTRAGKARALDQLLDHLATRQSAAHRQETLMAAAFA
jgi:peptidoglycan/xylan/chitin deacetylase (PgdA/CDA1 family)